MYNLLKTALPLIAVVAWMAGMLYLPQLYAYHVYDLIKALHLIAVMAWMAGMLYLPRLYVYHAGVAPGSEASALFKIMERRLLRAIINPAMIATWGFGLYLLIVGEHWGEIWFTAKLCLLIGMQIFHAFLSRWRRAFASDRNRHSARFFRWVNEIPTILMIGIVLLAVLKPAWT